MPPRFQRSRYWTKDQGPNEWRAEDDRPRRSDIRDYEVDDHRTYDYEKDDDDDDPLGPHITDWSLDVEEEEERLLHLEKQQSLPDPKETAVAARGIIRLPPDAMTSNSASSSSNDWRAHPNRESSHHYHPPHHSHQQQSQQNHSVRIFLDKVGDL